MLFCENPEDRFYERLMQTVSKQYKKDYLDNVFFKTSRFNEESEGYKTMFKNERHKSIFEETVRKKK